MNTLGGAVTAQHVAGPMWTVGGAPVVVPNGVDAPTVVLAQLTAVLTGDAPWAVEVRQGTETVALLVQGDGSVMPAPGTGFAAAAAWVRPAGTIDVPQPVVVEPTPRVELELVSGHYGSGASTWAQLLGHAEVTPASRTGLPVLLVVRSTIAGVEAAKPWTSEISAVLMVADAHGKVQPVVDRAIRVLAGAAPIVRVPWVPVLRGVNEVPDSAAVGKVVAKVAAAVEKDRRK